MFTSISNNYQNTDLKNIDHTPSSANRTNLYWENHEVTIVDGENQVTRKTLVSRELDPIFAEGIHKEFAKKLLGTGLVIHASDLNSNGQLRLVIMSDGSKISPVWEVEQIEVAFNSHLYSSSALVTRNDNSEKAALLRETLDSLGIRTHLQKLSDSTCAVCAIPNEYLEAILNTAKLSVPANIGYQTSGALPNPAQASMHFAKNSSDIEPTKLTGFLSSLSSKVINLSLRLSNIKGFAVDYVTYIGSRIANIIKLSRDHFSENTRSAIKTILKIRFLDWLPKSLYLKFAAGTAAILFVSPGSTSQSHTSDSDSNTISSESNFTSNPEMIQNDLGRPLETKRRGISTILPLLATSLAIATAENSTQRATWTEEDVGALANLLTKENLGTFHCQGCIDAKIASFKESSELDSFYAKTVSAIYKAFIGQPDKIQLFSQIAEKLIKHSSVFVGQNALKSEDFSLLPTPNEKLAESVSCPVNNSERATPNIMPDAFDSISPTTERLSFNFSGGPYAALGSNGKGGINFYGQGGFRFNLDPFLDLSKFSFDGAFSVRPDLKREDIAPNFNPLTARFLLQARENVEVSLGLTTSIGNPAYDVDPFSNSTPILPCGCTGISDSAENLPARMGIFDNALWERSVFGVGARINLSENTKITLGSGFSYNDESRDNWQPQLKARIDRRFSDRLRGSVVAVQSPSQLTVDAGLVAKPKKDLTVAAAVSVEHGKKSSTSVQGYVKKENLFNNNKLSGLVSGSIKKDHDVGDIEWQVLAGATFKPKPKSNWDVTLGGYVSGDLGKSSEPVDKGVVGALTFKF